MVNLRATTTDGDTGPELLPPVGTPMLPKHFRLDVFMRERFGVLNTAVESKSLSLSEFVKEVTPVLHACAVSADRSPILSITGARKQLGVLGMIASALEKHAQGEGDAPGAGVALVHGLEARLMQLARIAGRIPRDDHHSYWLEADGSSPATFTAHASEIYFIHAVRRTVRQQRAFLHAVEPLLLGEVKLSSHEAETLLEVAATAVESLWHAHAGFAKHMEPAFFGARMRTYLLSYPIGGAVRTGPNATNNSATPAFDFSLGLRDPDYCTTVRNRFVYYDSHEMNSVERAMSIPGLDEVFVEELLGESQPVATVTATQTAVALLGKPCLVASARKLAAIGKRYREWSAVHAGRIRVDLVRWAEKLTPEQFSALRPSPAEGVSGQGLQRTFDLHARRASSYLAKTLGEALAILDSHNDVKGHA